MNLRQFLSWSTYSDHLNLKIMFVRISALISLIGAASAACNPGGNFDEETGIPCGMCGDLISVAAFDNFNPSLS